MKNQAEVMVSFDNLESLNEIKARQEAECRRELHQLIVDMADGVERHQSEVLGILHWNNVSVEQVRELVAKVQERRAKLSEIERLHASQSGMDDARAALAQHKATFKAAEDFFHEHINRLEGAVNSLQSVPYDVARLRRELQQSCGDRELQALQDADRAITVIRDKLQPAKIATEDNHRCVKSLQESIEQLKQDRNADGAESQSRRLAHFTAQAKQSDAVVATFESDLEAAIKHRETCLNACLVATAV